jgi:hypothetical protein
MDNLKRTSGNQALDSGTIANIGFNEAAGVHKVAQAGLKLKPLPLTGTTFTTDASTIRKIQPGSTLALFNNNTTVAAFRLSKKEDAAALAAGAVDNTAGDGFGDVGVPVAAGAWHYTNAVDCDNIITSAATLLVFLVEDESRVATK